jgi:alkylhydroperoxidase family enzyme
VVDVVQEDDPVTVRIPSPNPLPEIVALTAPNGETPPITIEALAHCEALLEPFLGWAAALALKGVLNRRDHEILALRAAHNCGSEFEWAEHSRFARQAGLTEEEIERVALGGAAGWSHRDQLLICAADELHVSWTIRSATWADLTRHFSVAELVEATFVVGQYAMLSMVANIASADDA